jgi:hypothetical protein
MKIVLLEKQSRRAAINIGYKVSTILEKDFTLILAQSKAKALEVPSSGL